MALGQLGTSRHMETSVVGGVAGAKRERKRH
jgi:hypothetical protein